MLALFSALTNVGCVVKPVKSFSKLPINNVSSVTHSLDRNVMLDHCLSLGRNYSSGGNDVGSNAEHTAVCAVHDDITLSKIRCRHYYC